MLPQGDTTGPKSRRLVFPEGDIADPQMSNEATDGLAPSVFCNFSGAVKSDSRAFLITNEERPEARYHRFGFASCSRGLVFPDGDIAGLNSNTGFDSSFEYSTEKVVLFWQPQSYFAPWSRSPFAVDDVQYSYAEQYTMPEKTRHFQHHRAVGLIMSWPSPSTRKRIGRGVRNLDSGVGDREKQNAVLSGIYAKFTQNPDINNYLLSSDNKRLAESSPLDPVWGTGVRVDGPRADNPCQEKGKRCSVRHSLLFAKLFTTMRPGRRTRPPLVCSVHALQMQESRNLVRAAAGPLTAASAHEAFPSVFPTYFSARLPVQSRGGLEKASGIGPDLELPEHGPCFVKGTVTLDDVLFTMKITYMSRATLDSDRHWTPLDLGTGSIVWAPNRLQGYCGEQSSAYPPATRHRRALAKWGSSMPESSGRLSS